MTESLWSLAYERFRSARWSGREPPRGRSAMKMLTTIAGLNLSSDVTSERARTIRMGSDAPTVDQGSHPQPFCFGRYRVLRLLGQGSFGDVFLAQDEELKR